VLVDEKSHKMRTFVRSVPRVLRLADHLVGESTVVRGTEMSSPHAATTKREAEQPVQSNDGGGNPWLVGFLGVKSSPGLSCLESWTPGG
jgi:hypothetical protein